MRAGVRPETRDLRLAETLRQRDIETLAAVTGRGPPAGVSMSHVFPAGLGSQVSCPRAHAHLARGGHARGTPLVAICEVAGMEREITVRNVVWGNCGWCGARMTRDVRREWRLVDVKLRGNVASPMSHRLTSRRVSRLSSLVRAHTPIPPAADDIRLSHLFSSRTRL